MDYQLEYNADGVFVFPRHAINIMIFIWHEGRWYGCPTKDLSASGVFIETDLDLHPGQQLHLMLSLYHVHEFDAQVVRCGPGGIAISFPAHEMQLIEALGSIITAYQDALAIGEIRVTTWELARRAHVMQ